jgi:hypothetical protein
MDCARRVPINKTAMSNIRVMLRQKCDLIYAVHVALALEIKANARVNSAQLKANEFNVSLWISVKSEFLKPSDSAIKTVCKT